MNLSSIVAGICGWLGVTDPVAIGVATGQAVSTIMFFGVLILVTGIVTVIKLAFSS